MLREEHIADHFYQGNAALALVRVKHRNAIVEVAELPPIVSLMFEQCLATLPQAICIETVIQINAAKHRHHRKQLRGIMTYRGIRGTNEMTLYTYDNPAVEFFCQTIAHEIGHFHHYLTSAMTMNWTHGSKEAYADSFMTEQFFKLLAEHPVTPQDRMLYKQLRGL